MAPTTSPPDVILPICCLLLLFTQFWSAWVIYMLALKSRPENDTAADSAVYLPLMPDIGGVDTFGAADRKRVEMTGLEKLEMGIYPPGSPMSGMMSWPNAW